MSKLIPMMHVAFSSLTISFSFLQPQHNKNFSEDYLQIILNICDTDFGEKT